MKTNKVKVKHRRLTLHINRSLIPIEVARFRRARVGLDPSGSIQRLELATRPASQDSSWNQLLDDLIAFGESCRSHVRHPKVMLV